MKRRRLDDEMIARGICQTRDDALRMCMAGLVSCAGERFSSPAVRVEIGCNLHVKGRIPYVSRGGLKLSGALDAFLVDVHDLYCLDIGCSSGGFTALVAWFRSMLVMPSLTGLFETMNALTCMSEPT